MGWVRLAGLCVAVGVVLRLARINPLAPDFDPARAALSIGRSVLELLGWAVMNGWAPLLTGAVVVLPVWLLWRLASLPFRR